MIDYLDYLSTVVVVIVVAVAVEERNEYYSRVTGISTIYHAKVRRVLCSFSFRLPTRRRWRDGIVFFLVLTSCTTTRRIPYRFQKSVIFVFRSMFRSRQDVGSIIVVS